MKKVNIFFLLLLFSCVTLAKEFHVSVHGSDNNDGTVGKPLKTISAAAHLAQPGDTITVHAGTYKERVDPPRGGLSDSLRIVYRAAPGEKVQIKGSELIKEWEPVQNGIWKVILPNTFFADYNPYQTLIDGDWFDALGRNHHTGEVYLNGKSLYEVDKLAKIFTPENVIDQEMITTFTDFEGATYTWYTESNKKNTTIYGNFHNYNPNREMVEINVRETCFYPSKPGVNYITVSGFYMSQAATPWAAPTAEQVGLVGTHWSKGWIIENNVISDSKCVGITLGKDRSSGNNLMKENPGIDGSVLYNEVIVKAIANGWTKENIGSHIVRGNTIFNCGAAGICGSLGAAYSEITENHIYDIWTKRLFTGPEKGGIKIHAAIDVLIKGNRIHNAHEGIWLDWMAQGTRVTSNLCYNNDKEDFFAEVNHGPYMVDNNLFLSQVAIWDWSTSGAYINNLIAGKIFPASQDRKTPYFKEHTTNLEAVEAIQGSDNRFYYNIFTTNGDTSSTFHIPDDWGGERDYGLAVYNNAGLPITAVGNVYLNGSKPYKTDQAGSNPGIDPDIRLIEKEGHVYLLMSMGDNFYIKNSNLVTTEMLGKTALHKLGFENPDGSSIVFDTDYFGKKRSKSKFSAGPFEGKGKGTVKLEVW